MLENFTMHDIATYGGYIDDDSLLLQSASGGIATAMAQSMIRQSGYVAGVAYRKDFSCAEYIIIDKEKDIQKLKGSKYIECEKQNIFSDVKALLDAGEQVLFFGLPCMVAALYIFLGQRPENLLTCELICHGPTSASVHKAYIEHLETTFHSKIVDFSVRHKKGAWLPIYLYAKFDNGKIFEKPFYETAYGYAFSVFGRQTCYQCQFKGNNRQADIMIGDFWGAKENDPYWNSCGVSAVFAETQKGNDFLLSIPNIKLFPTTFENAVRRNPMVIQSKKKPKNRDTFAKLFAEKGLLYAVKHSKPLSARIKSALLQLIPQKVRQLMRKLRTTIQ